MKDKQLDNSQRSKLQTVLQRDQLHSKSFNSLFRDISATSKSHSFGLKNNIKHVNRKTDREGKILDHKEKSVNTTDNIKNCKSDQVRANFRRKYPSVSKKALRSERRQHKFGILASDSTSMLKADFQNGYGTMDSEGITDHKQVQNIHGMETAEIAPLIITSKTFSDSNSFDDDIINRKPYIIPNQQHGVSQLKEPSHMMNELELGRIKQQVKPGILNKIMIRGGEGHGSGYMTRKYNYYYEISNPVIEIPPHVRVIDTVATEVSLDERNHNFAISMSDFAMPILAFNFLQNAVRIYSNVLQTHPLPVKMITAGLIGGLGDMLVQLISQKRMKQPFSLRRCLVFMAVCTFYNAPVVHYWFNLLGSIGSKLTNLSDLGRALSLTFIDQTIGAIVLNSGFYFAFELVSLTS